MHRAELRAGLFVVAMTTVYLVLSHGAISADASQIISDHAMTILPAIGAVAAFVVSRRAVGAQRLAWLFVAGWGTLSAAGNAAWSYYELVAKTNPFPSVADAGYLAGTLFAAAAMVTFVIAQQPASKLRTVLDAALIGASVFLVSWALALHAVYSATTGTFLERSVGLAYPVLDIFIVSLIVFSASRLDRRGRSSLVLIGCGLIGWALADTSFAYLTTINAYHSGGPVDAGWIGGDALMAAAALLALRRRSPLAVTGTDDLTTSWRMSLPYVVGGGALVVGLASQIVRHQIDTVLLGAAVVVLMVVVLRQFLLVLEHQRETIARMRDVDEMKNDILHAVSHELRTPLTVITGTAAFLEETGATLDPVVVQDMYGRMVRNADRLEALLTGLLDLERLTRGVIEPNRHPTDVATLLCNVAETVGRPDHPISVRSSSLVANVDAGQVERIVENLFRNAARHTPDGTPISATAERTDDGVLITVEDTGPGVPEDVRDVIFEAFVQTEASVKAGRGTGIGLSLVAKFAELHGGRAWVEDAEPHGARFRVLLAEPAAERTPEADEAAA